MNAHPDGSGGKPASALGGRESDLIRLVYTLAVEPQQLHLFLSAIDGELEDLYATGEAQSSAELLGRIDDHIDTANTLMDRQAHGTTRQSLARRAIDADRKPALLVAPDMQVRHANTAAMREIGATVGERLNSEMMDRREYSRLSEMVASLPELSESRFLGVFEIYLQDGDTVDKMVLSRTNDRDGRPVGHLASLRTRWQEHTGRGFSEAFGLTPAEEAIVQAIVEGSTLGKVADDRGTALGTVRNQAKRLLSKLGLHSQTELVCLYAGFSQVSPMPTSLGTTVFPAEGMGGVSRNFTRSDGSNLEYEIYGSPTGRPVLFLHPMVGGTNLSQKQRDLIARHDLRMIMPWCPHYKGTQDNGPKDTVKQRFGDDLARLLADLGVEECAALAINTSVVYAITMAERHPGLITNIVVGNAPVPLTTRAQFKTISVQQRMPYYIARHMPRVLDFYVKSIRAKLEAGYEEEYVAKYYEDSPIDLATIMSPEIRELASQSIAYCFQQGHRGMTNHMQIEAADWQPLLERSTVPIQMVTGALDTEYRPEMVRAATASLDNVTCHTVADAGTLIWFQQPGSLFRLL